MENVVVVWPFAQVLAQALESRGPQQVNIGGEPLASDQLDERPRDRAPAPPLPDGLDRDDRDSTTLLRD